MKMKPDMCDMEEMEDMCEMEEMEDMCDMDEEEMIEEQCGCNKYADGMKHMEKNMCDKFPECIVLAHSYVPWQYYEKAFTPPEALMRGTLFPELWGVYKIPK